MQYSVLCVRRATVRDTIVKTVRASAEGCAVWPAARRAATRSASTATAPQACLCGTRSALAPSDRAHVDTNGSRGATAAPRRAFSTPVKGSTVRKRDVVALGDGHARALWLVRSTRHVKPGKGPAYLQVELSALKGGVTKTKRLRMQETVELVELQKGAKFTFLYGQGDKLVLMDDETFEQLELPREMLGVQADFLNDGAAVSVTFVEGEAVLMELTEGVVQVAVADTGPNLKKERASDGGKPALLDNGVTVTVPSHIMTGDIISVKTTPEEAVFAARLSKAS